MASTLDASDVTRIAALARLELTPDEVTLFSKQLGDILHYVETLREVDTSGVPPTSHPVSEDAAWRPDDAKPSLNRDDVLDAAPGASKRAGLFKVPKVL